MSTSEELHLIGWLRKISIDWEISEERLASLCHCPLETLRNYLALSTEGVENLPTIPEGLDSAMVLVGLFKRIREAYPDPTEQNLWLMRENSVFEGHRPIDVMAMSPDHLAYVGYTVESGLRLGAKE
jgi:hypothetical protein